MDRKKLLFNACLVFIFWQLWIPRPVYCQGNTWAGVSLAQVFDSARWRLGPLRVNAAMDLSNAGYDSDIYFGYTSAAAPDWTFSASTPIQVLVPVSKNIVLDFFDTPQYVFYLAIERERAWNNTFEGQIHFALKRIYIRAGGRLANVRERMSPELNINVRELSNSINGLVLWQTSRPLSFAALCRWQTFDYGDATYGGTSLAEALNRKEVSADFVTYLQPNHKIRFYIDGQYGSYAFTTDTSESSDARSYGLLAGFDFIPRAEGASRVGGVQGSASLGYTKVDMLDPGRVDGSGLAGDINLSVGIMKRTMARVFFFRDFQFSIYSAAGYYFSSNYGAGLSRFLSRRAELSYELSFGRSSYPEVAAGGDPLEGIRNLYTTHVASLRLTLARYLTMSIIGTFAQRSFEGSGEARKRNFIGLNLLYGTTRGIMSAPMAGSFH
jgi:hypothetical protein